MNSKDTLYKLFEGITKGSLRIIDASGHERSFGVPGTSPHAVWIVKNDAVFERIESGAALALGESYMDGDWEVENDAVCDFLGVILVNHLYEKVKENPLLLLQLLWHRLRHSSWFLHAARNSIRHHYDMGNDFFSLMLDKSMTYSCGYERRPEDSLEQMQAQKYRHICSKLNLRKGGTLIDIGCGWGGMLSYAGQHFADISGNGITLSTEQCAYANQRFEREGIGDRMNAQILDYRKLYGTFDFLVSIGMFEHVGKVSYSKFMRKAASILKEGGIGLLHTIGVTDPPFVKPDPWSTKYIFPGTRLPRLEEIAQEMRKAGLLIAHVENLKPHYAETLRRWKRNVDTHEEKIRALSPKFDERFMKMWNYYLQSCEAGFRYTTLQVYQVLFSKGEAWQFPMCLEFE